jgi:large subunit ribosomal protein L18
MDKKLSSFDKRARRNRTALASRGNGRARLSVHRTSQHIYVQLIDDAKGGTVAAASTLEKDLKAKSGATVAAATEVGKLIAARAVKAGVKTVVFDRGGYLYHGRVKALAEAARAAGLEF